MLKKIALAIAVLLGVTTVLAVGGFAAAQTQLARDQVAGAVEGALEDRGLEGEVEGIEGLLPFDVKIGSVRLRDEEGLWFELDDARMSWSPRALLSGAIEIDEVSAARIAVARAPVLPPAPPAAEDEPPAEPFELDSLRETALPDAAIDALRVDRIELGEGLIGQNAVFRLDGRAATRAEGGALDANLVLERTDQPTAGVELALAAELAELRVDLDLGAREEGGIVAGLVGREDVGPLSVSLTGSGPLDAWRAQLAADAPGLIDLGADFAVSAERPYALELNADLAAGEGLLPTEFAPLIGDRLDLAIAAEEGEDGRLRIGALDLSSAFATLTGSGEADIDGERIDASATLELPDLALASDLAGGALAGSGSIDVRAVGTLLQPELDLDLALSNFGFDAISFRALRQRLTARPSAPLNEAFAGGFATGDGRLEGLALDGGRLFPSDTLDWTLDAEPLDSGLTDASVALRSAEDLVLDLSARMDLETLAGSGRLDARIGEFARWIESLGPELTGGLALEGGLDLGADFALAEGAERADVDLELALERLAGLPDPAGELLGRSAELSSAIAWDAPGQRVEADGLSLKAGVVDLSGDVGFGLEDQSLSGDLRLNETDLAALEPVIGQPIQGRGSVDLSLGGVVAEPDIRAEIDVASLAIAGTAIDELGLDATLRGPAATPAGTLSLAAMAGGAELAIDGGYAFDGEVATLSDLTIAGPETRIAGDVEFDLSTTLARGALSGAIGDLGALTPFHGQNLRGAIDIDAAFSTPDGGQALDLDLAARGVGGDFGELESLTIEARGDGLTGEAPNFEADLALSDFAQPGLRVERATVRATGDLGEIDVVAEASGRQAQPFAIRAEAALDVLGADKTIGLSELTGDWAGAAIELESPATLELKDGVLELDRLDIRLEESRIQSYFSTGGESVRAGLYVDEFDLPILAELGGPELGGTARLALDLFGEASNPSAVFELAARDIAYDASGFDDLPTATLDVGGSLEAGEVRLGVNFTGLTDEPAVAAASFPFALSFDPFSVDAPSDAPLGGAVRAEIDLARLTSLIALDGQRLDGLMMAELDFGGTLAEPAFEGLIELDGARIENASTGTVLDDVSMRLTADASELVVETLRATDGEEGRLSGTGFVRFEENYPFEASLDLDGELVRLREARVTLDGELRASGDLEAIDVFSRLTVDPAELRIPDEFGVDVPMLEVVEIYAPGEEPPPPPPVEPSGPEIALDVAVDVPARMFLRGRGLDSEWGGAVRLKGSAADPEITGEIELRRGIMDFLDRRFELRAGSVDLDGAFPPNPRIFVEAAAEADTITAIALLEGEATNPTLTLTSEPELPQDEVLAQLLFDRDLSQITPAQGVRLAAAISRLQGGGLDVLGQAREALGVDTLDVGGTGADDAKVSAGKYITEEIFVEVERGVAEGSGRVVVEFEFNPYVTFEAEVTESSQSGVGAELKYDY